MAYFRANHRRHLRKGDIALADGSDASFVVEQLEDSAVINIGQQQTVGGNTGSLSDFFFELSNLSFLFYLDVVNLGLRFQSNNDNANDTRGLEVRLVNAKESLHGGLTKTGKGNDKYMKGSNVMEMLLHSGQIKVDFN